MKIKLKRLVKKRYVACFFPLKFKIQDIIIISEILFKDTENVYDFHKLLTYGPHKITLSVVFNEF
jgi:hypothetical protein